MGKDRLRLVFALMLLMLVAAIGIAAVTILSTLEDCGPDGDCNMESSPSGLIVTKP